MKTKQLILCTSLLLFVASVSFAQKATEMYIPIGQSPGLSGVHTLQGDILSYNLAESTCVINTINGPETLAIIGNPKIWLDYNKLKRKNQYGSFSDMKLGMTIECKFVNAQTRDSIEWIKVEMKSLD